MATKKELIKSITDNVKNNLDVNELEGKTNRELTAIIDELESQEEVVEAVTQDKVVNMEAMMEEMKAEIELKLRTEMELKVRAEMEEEAKKSTSKKEIDRHRMIPVMNMTNGKLVYASKKSGAVWKWESYGDVDEIEFHEIQTMRTSAKMFISDPMIMILDEEVVSYMGLDAFYKTLLELEELDKIFQMPNKDFEDLIEKAPRGIIVSIVSRAREKAEDDTLDSRWKVKYLNKKFNTDIGQRG